MSDSSRNKKPKRLTPPRSEFAKRAFEINILRLLALGMTEDQIAKKLEVPRRWIVPVAHKAEQGFKKLSSESLDVIRGREIAQIEALQQEALDAYEKSKEPRKVTVVEGRPDDKQKNADGTPTAKPQKVTQTTEQRHGDIRYLDSIVRMRERYAKIMGVDQPIELKHVHARYQEGKELLITAVKNVCGDDIEMIDKIAIEFERLESERSSGSSFFQAQ